MIRDASAEHLRLYGRELLRLLETEAGRRLLLEKAYRETVASLTSALESKDTGTRAHSQRVEQYAIELARAVEPKLAENHGTRYGVHVHDAG